jgi:hypothetical protein
VWQDSRTSILRYVNIGRLRSQSAEETWDKHGEDKTNLYLQSQHAQRELRS